MQKNQKIYESYNTSQAKNKKESLVIMEAPEREELTV